MSDKLPQGWAKSRIADIAVTQSGGTPSTARREYWEGGDVPWINSGELKDTVISAPSTYITKLGLENSSAKMFPPRTVVIALTGATTGRVGLLDFATSTNQSVTGIFPSPVILPEYLFFYLRSVRDNVLEQAIGSAQPHINKRIVDDFEVPLAPLDEQRRLAAKLEGLLGKADACHRRLAKIPVLLKRFRQAVLAAACSGQLTADWREKSGQDDEWPIQKLSALGRVTGGITKNSKRQTTSLQVPYLRVANVYENRLELSEVFRIGVTKQEFERTRLVKGDVLFVEGNGSLNQIGRVALWDGSIARCVHQNHLIKFRGANDVLPDYVLLQMMAPEGRSQLIEKATSSAGLNTLSISKISDVHLPVPPLAEQQEIVRRVEALFALADQIATRFQKARSQLDQLTPSLLARAFRGELVPTEAELAGREGRDYEDAQSLLQRLSARNDGAKPAHTSRKAARRRQHDHRIVRHSGATSKRSPRDAV